MPKARYPLFSLTMRLFIATVLDNVRVADGYNELAITWSRETEPPLPGQFATLRCGRSTAPLLRRPFAFSSFDTFSSIAKMIVQERGPATAILARARPGDSVDVLGPLGNSFPSPAPGCTPVLVAGGVGIGPIVYFAGRLARLGRSPVCVFGARSAGLLPASVLARAGPSLVICTEDGTEGIAGNVVAGLESLDADVLGRCEVYVCGPSAMMAVVAKFAERRGARCWVSMEQIMACGVGACMGCAIRVKSPEEYARVCTEGPVFDACTIVW